MNSIISFTRPLVLTVLILTGFVASALAQEVSIPDPGLNAAIREALQKPSGPFTEQDLLSLTNLNARSRNVSSIVGLEAARNLVSLDRQINHLSNLVLLSALTNLSTLDLSVNPLTTFSLPSGLSRLVRLPAWRSSDRSDRPCFQSERTESHARWRLRQLRTVLPVGHAAFLSREPVPHRFRPRLPSGARHGTAMSLTHSAAPSSPTSKPTCRRRSFTAHANGEDTEANFSRQKFYRARFAP